LIGQSGSFTETTFQTFLDRASRLPVVTGNERMVFGHFGRDLAEILVTGASGQAIESVREELHQVAGRMGEAARWGAASFPVDGASTEELWAASIDRLLGMELLRITEVPRPDPCMARLWGMAERLSNRMAPLLVVGEQGVGKETIARVIRFAAAPGTPFIVHRASRFERSRWSDHVARAAGGALHVRYPEALPAEELAAFLAATAFRSSAGTETLLPSVPGRNHLFVPPLRDRPADVFPVAEYVLHKVDERLARRKSTLRVAPSVLSSLVGPDNVRSLRNAIIRGAFTMETGELRYEHIRLRPDETGRRGAEGVRDRLREAERGAIQDALRETGWNVSEAARLMQLPRRTLVYRMSKLSVRRATQ
jgi:transcriptional regulator of acetoin/glycerol metabolism